MYLQTLKFLRSNASLIYNILRSNIEIWNIEKLLQTLALFTAISNILVYLLSISSVFNMETSKTHDFCIVLNIIVNHVHFVSV